MQIAYHLSKKTKGVLFMKHRVGSIYPFTHCLPTIHPWQTDDRRTTTIL